MINGRYLSCFAIHSGVARNKNIVGHKQDTWCPKRQNLIATCDIIHNSDVHSNIDNLANTGIL